MTVIAGLGENNRELQTASGTKVLARLFNFTTVHYILKKKKEYCSRRLLTTHLSAHMKFDVLIMCCVHDVGVGTVWLSKVMGQPRLALTREAAVNQSLALFSPMSLVGRRALVTLAAVTPTAYCLHYR